MSTASSADIGRKYSRRSLISQLFYSLPEAYRLTARLRPDPRFVDVRKLAMAQDPRAVDHHALDVLRRHGKHPMPGQILSGERRWRIVLQDDQVGGGAGIKRADSVGEE